MRVGIVGGAGHVGLPLSLLLAERGCHVSVIDIATEKLKSIGQGNFPFLERGGPELLRRCLAEFPERLQMTDQFTAVSECDVVVLTIGTPVDEHLNPYLKGVEECVRSLRPYLRAGQTLLLRSTLFPGTSARILEMVRGMGHKDVGVCFCPERIAQGFALEELTQLPQIISGSDSRSLSVARRFFSYFGVDVIEMELIEAEVAKLFLNSWRYVLFATANQFYQIALSKGLDFDRIRSAITHKYKRADALPRPGFTAGPCLFKDTMQLAAYCRHTFSLGHAAMLVNETMPDIIVSHAKEDLARVGKKLQDRKVGVLGMAFKPNNDDKRESLAYKLRRLLRNEGCEVLCTDACFVEEGFVDLQTVLQDCSVIFIGCPHKDYMGLQKRLDQEVYDCWGSGILKRPAEPSVISSPRGSHGNGGLSLISTAPKLPAVGRRPILVTGSQGFLMGYLIPQLLELGHRVIGLDNFSKYGELTRSYDAHHGFTLVRGDARDHSFFRNLIFEHRPSVVVSGACYRGSALYQRMAEAQKLSTALLDACVEANEAGFLDRLCIIDSGAFEPKESSSSTNNFVLPHPAEILARVAKESTGLPFVFVRVTDSYGLGELDADKVSECACSELALAHHVPQLVYRILRGKRPFRSNLSEWQGHLCAAEILAKPLLTCVTDSRAAEVCYIDLAPSVCRTESDFVKDVLRVMNVGAEPSDLSDNGTMSKSVPDPTRSDKALGFSCDGSMELPLKALVDYVRKQMKPSENESKAKGKPLSIQV